MGGGGLTASTALSAAPALRTPAFQPKIPQTRIASALSVKMEEHTSPDS